MIFISKCLKCRKWHRNKNMLMYNYDNSAIYAYERWLGYFPELHGPVCGSCKDDLIKRWGLLRMQQSNPGKFKEKYPNIVTPIPDEVKLIYDGESIKVYEEIRNAATASNNPINSQLKLKGGGILRYRDLNEEVTNG